MCNALLAHRLKIVGVETTSSITPNDRMTDSKAANSGDGNNNKQVLDAVSVHSVL